MNKKQKRDIILNAKKSIRIDFMKVVPNKALCYGKIYGLVSTFREKIGLIREMNEEIRL